MESGFRRFEWCLKGPRNPVRRCLVPCARHLDHLRTNWLDHHRRRPHRHRRLPGLILSVCGSCHRRRLVPTLEWINWGTHINAQTLASLSSLVRYPSPLIGIPSRFFFSIKRSWRSRSCKCACRSSSIASWNVNDGPFELVSSLLFRPRTTWPWEQGVSTVQGHFGCSDCRRPPTARRCLHIVQEPASWPQSFCSWQVRVFRQPPYRPLPWSWSSSVLS